MRRARAGFFFRLFLGAVPLLGRPAGALTRFLVTRRRPAFLVRLVIHKLFIGRYGALPGECEFPPGQYQSPLAFFTRRLKKGARPLAPGARTFLCPSDGRLAAGGTIQKGTLIQAKGMPYALKDLVGMGPSQNFLGGDYRVIYLAPGDYHRVHHPVSARLVASEFFPGRLYPVNETTIFTVPRVFVQNRRTVFHYLIGKTPLALVMVTAFNVGEVKAHRPIPAKGLPVKRGGELATFELGSTVVLLAPKGALHWQKISIGTRVFMGQALGHLSP